MSDILKKQKIEVIEGLEESAGCLRTESYDRYAEYVDEGITEITRLREENENLCLELDMQQATILVPSQKDDQRRIERLNSVLVEALDEAALLRAENEKLQAEVMSDYHEGFEEGVKAERERCAKIAEQVRDDTCDGPVAWSMADGIAAAIRE